MSLRRGVSEHLRFWVLLSFLENAGLDLFWVLLREVVQCSVVWCSVVWCSVVWCSVVFGFSLGLGFLGGKVWHVGE